MARSVLNNERRGNCRYPVRLPCVLSRSSTGSVMQNAELLDLSTQGALVRCDESISIGEQVSLVLPMCAEAFSGVVARTLSRRNPGWFAGHSYLIGLSMDKPWPHDVFLHCAFPQRQMRVESKEDPFADHFRN